MKKFNLIFLILVILPLSGMRLKAQTNQDLEVQAHETAMKVLKAFKDRDPDALVKYASGVVKPAISKSFFEDESLKDGLKAVDVWDGTIKSIRYKTMRIPGHPIIMATVYYSDVSGTDEINVLNMSKQGTSPWVFFSMGLDRIKRSKFEKMDVHITEGKKSVTKAKAPKSKKFSAEPAVGKTIENASVEQAVDMLKSLNKNNDYVSVSSGNEFIQFAWSKKGYTVQYRNKEGMFEADDLVNLETATQLLKNYMNGKSDWKEEIKWHNLE